MSGSVLASSINDAKDKKEELENKIEQAKEKIDALENQKVETQELIKELDTEIVQLETDIEGLEQDILKKTNLINQTLLDLEVAKENEQIQYQLTKERIKFMYEYGDTAYIEVLLTSKDLADLFSRIEYVEKVVEYDKNVLNQLLIVREEIVAYEDKLQNERLELDHLNAELNLQKEVKERALVMKTNELESTIEDIDKSIKDLENYEGSLKETEDLIKKLELESKLQYQGGLMEWPVPGYERVSSEFGYRLHPIFKTQSFHDGFDIPAPTGTKAIAVAAGQVVDAGWSTAYGNYLIIDHGSGYMSFYGHNSKLLVSEGDIVTTWQPVANIGSTGYSTGPHLHFGMRKSGEWINPREIVKNK
jgi:murein DD-endopeptidase MepM/ murein hydrolase activator NlpD